MVYDKRMQYRTYRYVQRYTNLEKKCQICGEKAMIVCSDKYLEINLLCTKHKSMYNKHNRKGECDLPKIKLKECVHTKPIHEEIVEEIEKYGDSILEDIRKGYTKREICQKYKMNSSRLYKFMLKSENAEERKILAENNKVDYLKRSNVHHKNAMQKYRIEHLLSVPEFSRITGIPIPTIRKIENGEFEMGNKTKERLRKANIVLI